jgi:hypothetical protein
MTCNRQSMGLWTLSTAWEHVVPVKDLNFVATHSHGMCCSVESVVLKLQQTLGMTFRRTIRSCYRSE